MRPADGQWAFHDPSWSDASILTAGDGLVGLVLGTLLVMLGLVLLLAPRWGRTRLAT